MTDQSTVAFQCPNCGAGLAFDPEKGKFSCEFCLSDFSEEELSRTDAAQRVKAEEEAARDYCDHMNLYLCPNCGAEVTAEENTAADFCYYCHNPIVLSGRLSGQMKPHRIIPFAIDKAQAEKIYLDWARKKWFVPKDFKTQTHAEMIRGVYYPFWVTDADTESTLEAEGTRVRSWVIGNTKYTETEKFDIHRAGEIHFEDIVTCALSDEDKHMLEGILPYPSAALQDFSMPYLSGFVAKKRDIERESLTQEVRGRMESYATELLRRTAKNYNSVSVEDTKVKILNSHWEYALLPIWILTYRDRAGRVYTFALNGHTGKVFGELPISTGKLAILGGAVTVGATALLSMLGGVFF